MGILKTFLGHCLLSRPLFHSRPSNHQETCPGFLYANYEHISHGNSISNDKNSQVMNNNIPSFLIIIYELYII
jgi:hypothetical protein